MSYSCLNPTCDGTLNVELVRGHYEATCTKCGAPAPLVNVLRERERLLKGNESIPSEVDLDDLERLRRRATPGPWRWWTSCSFRRLSSDATGKDGDVLHGSIQSDGVADIVGSEEDRALIEAAVNALPSLIAEMRRMRSLNRNANAAIGDQADEMTRLQGEHEAKINRLRDLIQQAIVFVQTVEELLDDLDEDDLASSQDFIARANAALETEP